MSTETEKKPVNEMGDNPHINSNDGSSDTDEKKDIREQNTGPVCEEDPTKVVLRGIKGTVKWFSISKGKYFGCRSCYFSFIFDFIVFVFRFWIHPPSRQR